MRAWNIFSALALTAVAPRAASACAVCFSGSDESRLAFILTTALLSGLPLAMIGGAVYWVSRRARRREIESAPAGYLPNR